MAFTTLLSTEAYAKDEKGVWSELEDRTVSDYTNVDIKDGKRLFVEHDVKKGKDSYIKFHLQGGKSYVFNHGSRQAFEIRTPKGEVIEGRDVSGTGLYFLNNTGVIDAYDSGEYTLYLEGVNNKYDTVKTFEVYELYDKVEDVGVINLNSNVEATMRDSEYYYYAIRAGEGLGYEFDMPKIVGHPIRDYSLKVETYSRLNSWEYLDNPYYTEFGDVFIDETGNTLSIPTSGVQNTYAHVHKWGKEKYGKRLDVKGKTYQVRTGNLAKGKIKELKAGDRSRSLVADPIDSFSGNYIDERVLHQYGGANALNFKLSYDSIANDSKSLGGGYTHNFETYLDNGKEGEGKLSYYVTPNTVIHMVKDGNKYKPQSNKHKGLGLVETVSGYELKDNNGNTLNFNKRGELITKVSKTNNKENYIRDSGGKLLEVNNDRGHTYKFTYDNGRLIQVEDNIGLTINLQYLNTQLVGVEMPNNDLIEIEYENGKVVKLTQDSEVILTNYYDTKGRIKEQLDGNNNLTEFTYEEYRDEERVITRVNNQVGEITKEHDFEGNLLREEDELGLTTKYKYDLNNNLIQEVDKNGNKYNYEYDSNNNLIKEINPDNTSKQYEYDDNRNIVKVILEDGSYTSSEYNVNNQLTKLTDVLGNEITYSYDSKGDLIKEQSSDYEVNTEYDDNGNLTKVRRGGLITQYAYDGLGRIIETILPNNTTIGVEYDNNGNVLKTVNTNGEEETKEYNTFGNVVKVTDNEGIETNYEYDGNGNLLKEIRLGRGFEYEYNVLNKIDKKILIDDNYYKHSESYEYNARGELEEYIAKDDYTDIIYYEYDNNGNVIRTDRNGKVEEYEYNSLNQQVKYVDAEGNEEYFTYNLNGYLEELEQSNGVTVKYSYDSKGNLLSQTDGEGFITNYEYDSQGNNIKIIEPNKATTEYVYDGNNNVVKEINALGEELVREYNELGQLSKVKNNDGNVEISYTYDTKGNVESITNGNGNKTQFEYDIRNNLIRTVDALGNEVEVNTYDSFDNVVSSRDSLGNITEYVNNVYGDKVKQTDVKGNDTLYVYNAIGQLTEVEDAYGMVTEYQYTGEGNLEVIKSNNKELTNYSYDNNNNIVSDESSLGYIGYEYDSEDNLITHYNGRNQSLNYTYDNNNNIVNEDTEEGENEITYDSVGNKLKVEGVNGSIERKFDLLGRVITKTQENQTIQYKYDTKGNMVELSYPNNNKVKYEYDNVGNITKVIDWNNNITSYEYDNNERLVKTINSNGVEENREYDTQGRVVKINRKLGSKVLDELNYQYDSKGNIVEDSGNTYIYDRLGRLVESKNNTYTYDKSGNITEYNVKYNDSYYDIVLEYGNSNELTGLNYLAAQVDNDGNLEKYTLNGKKYVATYDSKNQLISYGDTKYGYDSEGNRVRLEDKGIETVYVVDNDSSKYSQVLVETTVNKGKETSKYHIYGNGLIGSYEDGEFLTNHYDLRGSTVSVSNSEGIEIGKVSYDEYGVILSKDKTITTNYLYNGQYGVETDDNGLYQMRNRYYNPELKRFMNRDILLGEFTETQTLNRYSYVNGNPISYNDPFGLERESINREEWLGLVHEFLGATGYIPILGTLTDVTSGVIYLNEGMYSEALLSGVSSVPLIGDSYSGIRKANGIVRKEGKKYVGQRDKLSLYDVGRYNDLKNFKRHSNNKEELGLTEIHHLTQKHPAKQVVRGYDEKKGASIVLPKIEHRRIPTVKGMYKGSPRDLLAKDIRDLRTHTSTPNSKIQELIRLNKEMHPNDFKK